MVAKASKTPESIAARRKRMSRRRFARKIKKFIRMFLE